MFTVSPACVKCGICAEVCPISIIGMDETGPKLLSKDACIRCGHCVASCPHAALDHSLAPLAAQSPLGDFPVLDADTAARFLRSRRSIRRYKPDAVPKETLLKLLDIARFAPTGGNSQGLSYLVVSDRSLLRKLSDATLDWMEEQINAGVSWIKPYAQVVRRYRQGNLDIFRNAPHLIVALAPKNFPIGEKNTRYSLAYAELYAPSLGLGTCWSGFFEMCAFAGYPAIYDLLAVPENMAITGAIFCGYPVYRYHRLVDRNPLAVDWR
ncbi:MAG: nitroreductase family protein [Sporomusaceae bacterium]|nr:nitroreductase family protein [Sporomusaceae bacterium]